MSLERRLRRHKEKTVQPNPPPPSPSRIRVAFRDQGSEQEPLTFERAFAGVQGVGGFAAILSVQDVATGLNYMFPWDRVAYVESELCRVEFPPAVVLS